jgi:hypothetical protein
MEGGVMAKGKKTGGREAKNASLVSMKLTEEVKDQARMIGDGCLTSGVETAIKEYFNMSIKSRKQNILATAAAFHTLIELDPEVVNSVAAGGPTPTGYTEHQRQASMAAEQSEFDAQVILKWCAILRPPLFKGITEKNPRRYENWRDQHAATVGDLSDEWAAQCDRESSAIIRTYEYAEPHRGMKIQDISPYCAS